MVNNSVRVQIASDLHLECWPNPVDNWQDFLTPSAPYLALVGDICEVRHKELWCGFIQQLIPYWKHIFIVNGNHEYYGGTVSKALRLQSSWIEEYKWSKTVHVLEKTGFDINEHVRVIGCTLWSRVPVWAERQVTEEINDYEQIHQCTVQDTNQWHEESVRWLFDEIDNSQKFLIVITHYAPLMKKTSSPEYEEKELRMVNHAFASDLNGLLQPPVMLWVFGHTHYVTDFFQPNGVRVVSNALGYQENEEYKIDKVVDLTY